jgi:hypothetical protein
MCECETPWKWRNLKKRLASFCQVTQDGDDEGCLRMRALPRTPEQVVLIRKAVGLPKRRPAPAHAFKSSATEWAKSGVSINETVPTQVTLPEAA